MWVRGGTLIFIQYCTGSRDDSCPSVCMVFRLSLPPVHPETFTSKLEAKLKSYIQVTRLCFFSECW